MEPFISFEGLSDLLPIGGLGRLGGAAVGGQRNAETRGRVKGRRGMQGHVDRAAGEGLARREAEALDHFRH